MWRATQERPSPVPSWAPPWLPWPGRPTAVSALSWARLRAAASATAEVGRLRLPALVAGEAHRSRQRALCWGLQMYVVARGVGPSAMLAYEYLTDRVSADTAGSTCLSWWFSLAPLLPDPPPAALTRRYVAEVAAVRGLRQPLVARSALASLDALAHQTLPRLRRSVPPDPLAAARLLLAVGALRGGCRFRTAVDAALGVWHAAPVETPDAIVLFLLAEKTDFQRAAVVSPLLVPLPLPGLSVALRLVRAALPAQPDGPNFLPFWEQEHATIRAALRTSGILDVRASRRHVAAAVDASGGLAAVERVLHHRPGSPATIRYTAGVAEAQRTAVVLAAALSRTAGAPP